MHKKQKKYKKLQKHKLQKPLKSLAIIWLSDYYVFFQFLIMLIQLKLNWKVLWNH